MTKSMVVRIDENYALKVLEAEEKLKKNLGSGMNVLNGLRVYQGM